MRYIALATDYDGTLATHGTVSPSTLDALVRLRATGRKLILVTGRELPDLERVFEHIDAFDLVVAENGAVLYTPPTKDERALAEPPPPALVERLRAEGIPVSVGRVIVATWEPHEHAVLSAIRELGLELQVIFNKGAVMVLPSGINKASGLAAALRQLGVSVHNTVGVGDAENDHAFLRICEVSAAVANALPSLKDEADIVTAGARGDGVRDLIDAIVDRDLADLPPRPRHAIDLGAARDGTALSVQPTARILVAGRSGSGKSTVAVALLERLRDKGYQFCLIDPEGDHDNVLDGVASIGTAQRAPTIDEVLGLAAQTESSVSVNLLAVTIADRPAFLADLLPHIASQRARSGAPHWLVIDEAHHMLAADQRWQGTPVATEPGTMLITVHPAHVSRDVLEGIDAVIGVGPDAHAIIDEMCKAVVLPPPQCDDQEDGESLFFEPSTGRARAFRLTPSRAQHLRHRRKYAQGELGEDKSFYFRGPRDELNLRAQNLFLFLQIGDGVDDATWDYHLRSGDYQGWFQDAIKDPELAAAVADLAADPALDARTTRRRVRELVEARYTAPA
jgi:HAD superfamily hydrolase (TIGR01484 family)